MEEIIKILRDNEQLPQILSISGLMVTILSIFETLNKQEKGEPPTFTLPLIALTLNLSSQLLQKQSG